MTTSHYGQKKAPARQTLVGAARREPGQSTPTAQIGNSPSLPMALEFRQLGDIDGYAPGLVAGEQLGQAVTDFRQHPG
jgi:hypothetical protein